MQEAPEFPRRRTVSERFLDVPASEPDVPEPKKEIEVSDVKKIESILRLHGHLREGESQPYAEGLDTLPEPIDIENLCQEVEKARRREISLSQMDTMYAAQWGLKDLSNIDFSHSFYSDARDFLGFNFCGSDLSQALFSNSDLSGTDFTGAELQRAYFTRSDISRAELSKIMIHGEALDLTQEKMRLKNEHMWADSKVQSGSFSSSVCSDCEIHNRKILFPITWGERARVAPFSPSVARRGVVLFQEGKPLGYMKLKGERTFLAMRTVENADGSVLFWKGMVYEFESTLRYWLELAADGSSREYRNTWRRADVERIRDIFKVRGNENILQKSNERFFTDVESYETLTVLTRRIENDAEPFHDILDSDNMRRMRPL